MKKHHPELGQKRKAQILLAIRTQLRKFHKLLEAENPQTAAAVVDLVKRSSPKRVEPKELPPDARPNYRVKEGNFILTYGPEDHPEVQPDDWPAGYESLVGGLMGLMILASGRPIPPKLGGFEASARSLAADLAMGGNPVLTELLSRAGRPTKKLREIYTDDFARYDDQIYMNRLRALCQYAQRRWASIERKSFLRSTRGFAAWLYSNKQLKAVLDNPQSAEVIRKMLGPIISARRTRPAPIKYDAIWEKLYDADDPFSDIDSLPRLQTRLVEKLKKLRAKSASTG